MPRSYRRFLWFLLTLGISLLALIIGQGFATIYLSTLPHNNFEGLTYVWTWIITVQVRSHARAPPPSHARTNVSSLADPQRHLKLDPPTKSPISRPSLLLQILLSPHLPRLLPQPLCSSPFTRSSYLHSSPFFEFCDSVVST